MNRKTYMQHKSDNFYGTNKFTIMYYKNESTPMLVRHNSPECGYHTSLVSYSHFFYSKEVCDWHSHRPHNIKLFLIFNLGRFTCGEFSLITYKYKQKSVKTSRKDLYMKVRHNCQKCNYLEFWVPVSKFLKRRYINCPLCLHEYYHQTYRLIENQFLKKVFSQKDNVKAQYIPAQHYIDMKTPILWWHMVSPTPHLFKLSPGNFLNNDERCSKCNRMSAMERYTAQWLHQHHIAFKHGFIFNDGILRGLHLDFKISNIAIEDEGYQHIKPMGYMGGKNKFQYTHLHDLLKQQYCLNYHIKLIQIWNNHNYTTTHLKTYVFNQLNLRLLPILHRQ